MQKRQVIHLLSFRHQEHPCCGPQTRPKLSPLFSVHWASDPAVDCRIILQLASKGSTQGREQSTLSRLPGSPVYLIWIDNCRSFTLMP
jgi:hypothetical protein